MGLARLARLQSPSGAEITLDGRRLVNFGGSSYLGLSGHPAIVEAGIAALRQCGSSGNPLPSRYGVATPAHQDVEAEAAEYFGCAAALYLPAGYLFGLAALATLKDQDLTVFIDERAHHSLREAVAACGLASFPYRHCDPADLRTKLAAHLGRGRLPLIVSDGLYSTFGQPAPVGELAEAARSYGGRLLLDEAHSFGVMGPTGRGVAEEIAPQLVLRGGSLGKAFGACGAVVVGDGPVITALRASSVGQGAAAGLPASAAMGAEAFRIVRRDPGLLRRLRGNVGYLKAGLRGLGLDIAGGDAPIAGFRIGADADMQRLRQDLLADGLFVFHSQYMLADGRGAIRCGIFADHSRAHLDFLLDALKRRL